jgi:hypothetical protein
MAVAIINEVNRADQTLHRSTTRARKPGVWVGQGRKRNYLL